MNVDDVLERLYAIKGARAGTCVQLTEKEAGLLVAAAQDAIEREPMLLELEGPLQIVGDIHGQYVDLLRLFEFKGPPPAARYLFLGDYVDRGPNGLECMFVLMALKVKYPDQIWLLRGNHECAAINRIYGFYDECKRRYSIKLWRTFQELFNAMPLAAVIERKIFCIHGERGAATRSACRAALVQAAPRRLRSPMPSPTPRPGTSPIPSRPAQAVCRLRCTAPTTSSACSGPSRCPTRACCATRCGPIRTRR